MKKQIASIGEKIDKLTVHAESTDKKIDTLTVHAESTDKKIDNLTEEFKSMDKRQDRMFDDLLEVKRVVKHLSVKFDQFSNILDKMVGKFNNHHDERIMLASGHKQVLEFSERLGKLEKIHPNSQHVI